MIQRFLCSDYNENSDAEKQTGEEGEHLAIEPRNWGKCSHSSFKNILILMVGGYPPTIVPK